MKKIKNGIFNLLLFCLSVGLLYFFIAACSYFNIIQDFLYNNNINGYFYDDSIILPIVVFTAIFIITIACIWLFFRKETSTSFRIYLTVLTIWSIIAWFINTCIGLELSENLKFLSLLPITVSIILVVMIFKELKQCNIKNAD